MENTAEEFEAFWQRYPRKVAKGYARRQWGRARRLASFEEIMLGLERYRKEVADKEPQFIAHPSTWLNGERWLDETGANESAPIEQKQPYGIKPFAGSSVDWPSRLRMYKQTKVWLSSWGPKPGEPNCEVPANLIIGNAA